MHTGCDVALEELDDGWHTAGSGAHVPLKKMPGVKVQGPSRWQEAREQVK